MIASQDSACRFSLRSALQSLPNLVVVAEAADASSVALSVCRFEPNIVFLDSTLTAALNGNATCLSACRVILIVSVVDRTCILEAFRFEARGIVLKNASSDSFVAAARAVAEGEYSFGSDSIAIIVETLQKFLSQDQAGTSLLDRGLTSRELDIIAMIAAGKTNRQIGDNLFISERTVKHYLTAIFGKLQLSNRLELAMFAVSNHCPSSNGHSTARRNVDQAHYTKVTCPTRD